MKYALLTSLLSLSLYAVEYEVKFENPFMCISQVKILPKEEIGLHYDVYPQYVVALQGGILTRIEADGSTTEIEFPTNESVFRPAESSDKMHRTVNKTDKPIELMIVQIKATSGAHQRIEQQ